MKHDKATQVSPRTRPKPSLGEGKDVVLREKNGGCVNLIQEGVAVPLRRRDKRTQKGTEETRKRVVNTQELKDG
ncbi:hypothetical protein RF55_15057 [Lasius niger]|uniref:Uncharacterized protein n=1 Tax=Lasius niger TaxID=67767 RepID=A0A0J7K6K1_LASNI|nr:hypothetical protein RF55_15057 [Lasius niger]